MKVVLIDPGKVSESWYQTRQCPNLGLAYIGANLKEHGHDVMILDMATYDISLNDLVDIIHHFRPQVVGVSAVSFNILSAYDVFVAVKSISSNIFTVLGGPHGSALATVTLTECSYIDAIVIGEGERAMLEICKHRTPGVYVGEPIHDLDNLPFPDWDMYNYSKYSKVHSLFFEDERHIYPIITSRGCAHNKCKFCYQLHGRAVRLRSPKNVVDEIEYNYHKFNANYWYIADSAFSPSRKHLIAICDEIIDRGLDISFKCQTRVDLAGIDILSKLKEAGCELIFYGIESGSQDILNRCGKNITLKQIREAVTNAASIGLTVRGSFILGLDGETKETVQQTISLAKELKSIGLDQAQYHCLDLYPGTEYWNMALMHEGSLKPTHGLYDWTIFSRQVPHVETNDLTIEDLIKIKKENST